MCPALLHQGAGIGRRQLQDVQRARNEVEVPTLTTDPGEHGSCKGGLSCTIRARDDQKSTTRLGDSSPRADQNRAFITVTVPELLEGGMEVASSSIIPHPLTDRVLDGL